MEEGVKRREREEKAMGKIRSSKKQENQTLPIRKQVIHYSVLEINFAKRPVESNKLIRFKPFIGRNRRFNVGKNDSEK